MKVGVLGVSNAGKSRIINSLVGTKVCVEFFVHYQFTVNCLLLAPSLLVGEQHEISLPTSSGGSVYYS